MRIAISFVRALNPFVRAALAFAAVVTVGGWLWFDWDARIDGFAGYLDRRAAREAGILAGAEWRAMKAAGDTNAAATGGAGCDTDACRTATALLAGRWAGIGDCASGNVYRFTDAAAEVVTLKDGRPVETISRRYRLVGAPVDLRLLRDGAGQATLRSVRKLPGDVEVFTLGRSAYVRRIFRAVDADTVKLVLVEQRAGRTGPAQAMIIDGAPTAGGPAVTYRRCPA
jgi:hypothetical protein